MVNLCCYRSICNTLDETFSVLYPIYSVLAGFFSHLHLYSLMQLDESGYIDFVELLPLYDSVLPYIYIFLNLKLTCMKLQC